MIKNYFKIAIRNFRKNPMLSLINIGGLTVGIAAVLLIGMYIYGEINYDNFQKNKSALFRVGFRFWQKGKVMGDGPTFVPPFAVDAKNEFPEVKSFTRISSERVAYVGYKDKIIKVENVHHADSTFFQLFSYNLVQGDRFSVLKEPYSIVLTNVTAQKLFGNVRDVIGKIVRLDNQTDYTVTGIAQEAPSNSHLGYNALISFSTLYKERNTFMDWNGGEQYSAYLLLNDKASATSLEKKLPDFMWRHINKQYSKVGVKVDATLQPVKDIHLYYNDDSGSLRTNIYVFSIVALLILIISCVNYINLTTTQAITRFKEIGLRKVFGAERSQLIKQFLTEAVVVSIIALIISVIMIILLSPVYHQITGKELPSLNFDTLPALLLLTFLIIVVGVVAGSYVAFYLSSFNVTRIFRSLLPLNTQSVFRKGLIVAQFVITIGLMTSTLIVGLQLKYSKNINPGYDRDHILVLSMVGENTQKAYPLLSQKLSQLPSVQQVSGVSEIPYDGITNNGFVPEGDTKAVIIHQLDGDENLLKTFNIKMVAGEYFSKDHPTLSDGYVINETLAKTLDWPDPLGKMISRNGKHKIIGVVKDFHFASLHDKIGPLIITNKPWDNRFGFLAIKYSTANTSAFVGEIRKAWKTTLPDAAFDYWFLDDAFNAIYKSEEQFKKIFTAFSVLSILLSLAGIFGLVALAVKQRTKEFGIRKVLGAGITDIIGITAKNFIWLIVIAAMIAIPVSWLYINKWLENFAYRVQVQWWLFGICGLAVLVITLSTISFQAIRAGMVNPVKSLRSE